MKKILSMALALAMVLAFAVPIFPATQAQAATFSGAKAISVNTAVSGNISSISDEDYYKFDLASAGAVTVSLSHPLQSDSSYYWEVHLYDASYTEIASRYAAGNTPSTSLPDAGLPAGTYYVMVEAYASYSWSSSTYSLTVGFQQSDYWEKELNGDPTKATPVSLNTAYSGSMRSSGDEDYYKFELASAGAVTASFSHELLGDSDEYWEVHLYDASYTEISHSYVKGDTTDSDAIVEQLNAGTYYVMVEAYASYSWSPSTYKLTITYTDPNAVQENTGANQESGDNSNTATYTDPSATVVPSTPQATAIKKLKAVKKGFTVKWAKVSGITGYQVQYARNKKFKKKSKAVVPSSVRTLKVKGLKGKKKYYVRVRSYTTYSVNGKSAKVYSAWSATKSVKTKK